MSKIFTTEITSNSLVSDNPIHQRLLKAYMAALPYVQNDVLEVGCGEGRGIDLIIGKAKTYTAIDKIEAIIEKLSNKISNRKILFRKYSSSHRFQRQLF
jgi:16S rRNA A1518/A1519 N6-dimethyltransferase RsmA/KsgA/DIM1 with predicted DNA glycosylase/AP lyase activity